MATKSRRKSTSVSEKLFLEPYRFSFFQATRMLQGVVRQWQKKGQPKPVGHDVAPQEESVRFAALPSLRFASSEIARLEKHERLVKTENHDIAEMQVSFMGLTGQSSVLPEFFTELQLHRMREKDASLRDFLDLLNHRAVSLFYRSWEKYRLPMNYERVKLHQKNQTDPITHALESLIGVDGSYLHKHLALNPEDLIFYGGFMSAQRRSASALEAALTEYLDISVKVNQFKGDWMPLQDDDRFKLPIFPMSGRNNCLGVDTVIGDEVFTVEGKFQLVLGPLNREQFHQLLPGMSALDALKRFTKMFVGASYQYELKYQLLPEAVDSWMLDNEQDNSVRLGWNSWLCPKDKAAAVREITVNVPY